MHTIFTSSYFHNRSGEAVIGDIPWGPLLWLKLKCMGIICGCSVV